MHSALTDACMSFSELKSKDVINVCDGSLLGCICDIEFNSFTGSINRIILPGNGLLASFSPKHRICISWCDVERIGRDTILVKYTGDTP